MLNGFTRTFPPLEMLTPEVMESIHRGAHKVPSHFRLRARKENYSMAVADHDPYSEWVTTGKKDMLSRATEKVEEILATHKPVPLSDAGRAGVTDALEQAREHYRSKGVISDADWSAYMEELKLEEGDHLAMA